MLADAGHTVIIPDYRLHPSVVFPEFISDVVNAILAAKNVVEQRAGDSMNQVVLMGHSSGAHTAAMLASDPQWLEGSGINGKELASIGLCISPAIDQWRSVKKSLLKSVTTISRV